VSEEGRGKGRTGHHRTVANERIGFEVYSGVIYCSTVRFTCSRTSAAAGCGLDLVTGTSTGAVQTVCNEIVNGDGLV
jgi:hypothetical protein